MTTNGSIELPLIISADDHIVEPATLWSDRLPASKKELGPHVVRRKGVMAKADTGMGWTVKDDPDNPASKWVDVWIYDDLVSPLLVGYAHIGPAREKKRAAEELMTYDEMLPGCYQREARLEDMDRNHTQASLCFPTIPRFCGQTFLERKDKDLALECVKIYNDWMIDEWCAGPAYGRLIPNTLIPLWSPELAAAEIYRCADKGSHAVCFPEAMHPLGLPTLYTGQWDPFLAACEATETVINMHIGSSSKLATTSPDAPTAAMLSLTHENSAHTLVDWILSGALVRHPKLKIALSEAQAGWLPFLLARIDDLWTRADMYDASLPERIPELPSEFVKRRVYTCIFNDLVGLEARDKIGMNHMMFEIDYPHADSTFPGSASVAAKLIEEAKLTDVEARQLLRENAIECYGLERWGITA